MKKPKRDWTYYLIESYKYEMKMMKTEKEKKENDRLQMRTQIRTSYYGL